MPIPSTIADLSTTASLNSPAGSDNLSTTDDYLRAIQAIVKTQDNATAKLAGATFTGYINEARGTVTMHATTMDLWAQPNTIDGSGSAVTITAIANAPQAGAKRTLYPITGTVITNGATFAVDGAANYTTADGDALEFEAVTTSTYKVHITKKDGTAVVAPTVTTITLGTDQATTSGTSIDFASIPATVKRITIMFDGVSTNGNSIPEIRIGDSGGIETSGYVSAGTVLTDSASSPITGAKTDGFALNGAADASYVYYGTAVLTLIKASTNTWSFSSNLCFPSGAGIAIGAGSKSLSATLDRLSITTSAGVNTFDAGLINISYES
ncbi:MAG: hypothetical protein WC733_02115 [Methylophilus sp.]|jgi:hypothetical protein